MVELGTIKLLMYMGLPGNEPHEVGELHLPLKAVHTPGGLVINVDVKEVVDAAGEVVAQIWRDYGEKPKADDVNVAWAEYRKDYGVPERGIGEARKAFLAGWAAARGETDESVQR